MLVIERSRDQIHRSEAICIFSWVKSRTIKSTPTCGANLKLLLWLMLLRYDVKGVG